MSYNSGDVEQGTRTAKPLRSRRIGPSITERLVELQRVGADLLPVWIRPPTSGPEHYTGLSRAKMYEMAGGGHIRTASIREPGQVKGCRLFNLASILDYIARCEAAMGSTTKPEEQGR